MCYFSSKSGRFAASFGQVAGNLAHALVEFNGKLSTMVAHWRGLEARGWLGWVHEDDAVIMCHFSWKSGSSAIGFFS
eukprot:CAMPEP_0201955858 /NCGR_PEP_ID=MMETSP0904-20121228/3302_1 /ASSEMBLY_ACC=CAM_ASM_000553 /TAXON_ID=420261 /ORGANISM="Thalassiosira antarctica, Strain CCMP982" /LENGTH=76 /DNA_ID=CAMNT_0048500095 /DNA_START=103 /DNA_END=330 /DNA_ORIENTATION=+